jgi:hypothetical protein
VLGPVFEVSGITPLGIGTALMYVGVDLSLTTAVIYTVNARREVADAKAERNPR